MSVVDIKFIRQGFENACPHCEACRAIQHAFSKPSLVEHDIKRCELDNANDNITGRHFTLLKSDFKSDCPLAKTAYLAIRKIVFC